MFKPAVHKMFNTESQRISLLGLVKEEAGCSTRLKIDILTAFEPEGCLDHMFKALETKCSESMKATFAKIKGVLGASLGLLLIPIQDMKDLITIISIKIFLQSVIQGRIELIDNLPLEEFITVLSIIYGFQFILKQMNAISSRYSSTEEESHVCYFDVFRCRVNLYWIPFVKEIVLSLQEIQGNIRLFQKKSSLDEMVAKLGEMTGEAEKSKLWSKILDAALDIEDEYKNLEILGERKGQLKIISIVGDILQGSILAIMLLRPDLRVRSLLKLSALAGLLGLDVRQMGAIGEHKYSSISPI